MEIDVIKEREVPISTKCIVWFLENVLKKEGIGEDAELSILFTDNKKIHELNLKYRKIDKPTNVLSFSMREGFNAPFTNILGDIVISKEYAAHEAKEMGIDILDRIIELLIHGVLHLLGYDHIRDEDYEKMREKEEFYFELWKEEKKRCLLMKD